MTPEDVLAVAEAGRRAGCKEALFSLGDQPERIFPEAKEFLRELGFATTLEYLAAMTELVLDTTGLLPHSNPGLMGPEDLRRLRESNVSLGLMLESTNPLRSRGAAHWRAPDKAPSLAPENHRRGRAAVDRLHHRHPHRHRRNLPKTRRLALRHSHAHEAYGHIQEVIVQPFRAKPGTRNGRGRRAAARGAAANACRGAAGSWGDINLQSPPNLVADDYPDLLNAGINDWGGISPVTRDFINPEAAWPQIPVLASRSAAAGFVLRERLAIYPEFAAQPQFVDPRVRPHLQHLRGEDGYARTEM